MSRSLLVGCLVAMAACSEDRASPQISRDPQPQRRVIEPPSGTVRPLPPYAITATEVGPYKLRQKVAALLHGLPSGPRIARFEIPGLLHTSLIRAEDDTVLIGGEPTTSLASSTTSFVAVIGSDVARTESGVHVGLRKRDLDKLGPLVEDPERARDPRLLVPTMLRNGRIVLDEDRVVAIVIVNEASSPAREPSTVPACSRPASSEGRIGACLTAAGETIETDGDEIVVRSVESEKVITSMRVPGLLYAVPLRNMNEGRDELVAIARTDDTQVRTWAIVVYRIEGGKRGFAVDPTPLYQLSSAQTRWIGADLRDVDLYVELVSRPDGIEVGGLLTTRTSKDKIRDVVVISPVTITRRHGKPPMGEAGDAGVSNSSPEPADAPSGADSAKL